MTTATLAQRRSAELEDLISRDPHEGAERASQAAAATLAEVQVAMGMRY